MKKLNSTILSLSLLFLIHLQGLAATFTSAKSGNWNSKKTWIENGVPSANDNIIINNDHTVKIQGNAYTHFGNITILEGGELVAKTGNSSGGFTFNGVEFHVFGKLTFPFPDRDFTITGNSLFWGHPSAEIFVSDDWIVKGKSTTIVEGICVEVDDDFHVESNTASVCGGGGVSIGNSISSNTFNLSNGASANQICLQTNVYRGEGGNCTTLVTAGSGNGEPIAYDDHSSTSKNMTVNIDVLNMDTPDEDPNNSDVLSIFSVGDNNMMNDGLTAEGGFVSINNNGTPNDPTDDTVNYVPPTDFEGTDIFNYIITDQNGAFQYAMVTVNVSSTLPVELVKFSGDENNCQVLLKWTTASEINNELFYIEKSVDGQDFISFGTVNGMGTTDEENHYQFVDEAPEVTNYYRLKQMDFDGQFSYSDVIAITSYCDLNDLKIGMPTIFPNPVLHQNLNLRFNAIERMDTRLLISNAQGRLVVDQMIAIEEGMNHFVVDVDHLAVGTYFLRIDEYSIGFSRV